MGLELQLQEHHCRLVMVGPQPHHSKPKAIKVKGQKISSNARTRRRARRRRSGSGVLVSAAFCNSKFPQSWQHRSHHYYNYYKYTLPNYSSTSISISISSSSSTTTTTTTTTTANCLLRLGFDDIAAVAHNKVLIAASVSAAIGQLSKPFTSRLLYGKDFDFMAAFEAPGFPSTHSSGVRREVGNHARVLNKVQRETQANLKLSEYNTDDD